MHKAFLSCTEERTLYAVWITGLLSTFDIVLQLSFTFAKIASYFPIQRWFWVGFNCKVVQQELNYENAIL